MAPVQSMESPVSSQEQAPPAISVTPVHRGSLIRPTYITIPPRNKNTSKPAPISPIPSRHLAARSDRSSRTSEYVAPYAVTREAGKLTGHKKWTAKLWHEPPNDAGTCCLGFFLPCVLYSKTQYRMYRVSQGKDALDMSGYKGCSGPCWAYYGLSLIRLECKILCHYLGPYKLTNPSLRALWQHSTQSCSFSIRPWRFPP